MKSTYRKCPQKVNVWWCVRRYSICLLELETVSKMTLKVASGKRNFLKLNCDKEVTIVSLLNITEPYT